MSWFNKKDYEDWRNDREVNKSANIERKAKEKTKKKETQDVQQIKCKSSTNVELQRKAAQTSNLSYLSYTKTGNCLDRMEQRCI